MQSIPSITTGLKAQSLEISQSLFSSKQVREFDRIAIEDKRIPGLELMERAGKAAWNCLRDEWPKAKKIMVICGAGNNGGDGYVVARHALNNNIQIDLVALKDPKTLQGDALVAAQKFLAVDSDNKKIYRSLSETTMNEDVDIIIDAMLGTGLERDVEGKYLDTILFINNMAKPVFSIDVPSGLNADTGLPMGAAIKAYLTVTFIAQKQGLYSGYSSEYRGRVEFNDLDIPQDIYKLARPTAELASISTFEHLICRRSRTGQKGDYGHVLVVGGDYGMLGAVCMCGEAAARTGAGLVSIATRKEHALAISSVRPELMALGLSADHEIDPLLERATVIATGPGLGKSDWSLSLFLKSLGTEKTLVLDADGLNLLAQNPQQSRNWILTPHPGEAARLLGCSVKEVQADRFAAARTLKNKFGGIIVLKGSGTIICGHNDRLYVCTDGNPGMATGGMGDLLTGIISGLLAQGFIDEEAAVLGCCIHAHAADLSADKSGERGMIATDLLQYIRQIINP